MPTLSIVDVKPKNLSTDVDPINLEIRAEFSDNTLPIKKDTVKKDENVFLLDSDSNLVEGELEVESYAIVFKPKTLDGNTTYRMNIMGDISFSNSEDTITDVDGNPFLDYYSWAFTTKKLSLEIPEIIYPTTNESLEEIPEIEWSELEEECTYKLEISDSVEFYNVLWATETEDTSYTPEELEPGQIYYARVKAIKEEVETPWSPIVVFSYQAEIEEEPEEEPEEEEEVIVEPEPEPLNIIYTKPLEDEINVNKNISKVIIKFNKYLDPSKINKKDIYMLKKPND